MANTPLKRIRLRQRRPGLSVYLHPNPKVYNDVWTHAWLIWQTDYAQIRLPSRSFLPPCCRGNHSDLSAASNVLLLGFRRAAIILYQPATGGAHGWPGTICPVCLNWRSVNADGECIVYKEWRQKLDEKVKRGWRVSGCWLLKGEKLGAANESAGKLCHCEPYKEQLSHGEIEAKPSEPSLRSGRKRREEKKKMAPPLRVVELKKRNSAPQDVGQARCFITTRRAKFHAQFNSIQFNSLFHFPQGNTILTVYQIISNNNKFYRRSHSFFWFGYLQYKFS